MNDLCADIGYKSVNHYGEQLCGDHVDIVEQGENSTVIVLADGLGSGVKASILSTLTSKIISTMMSEGLSLEDCVETIAATLPICSVRGVAYSTFTILHLVNNTEAELIEYDNPQTILLRDGKNYDYPRTEMNIGGKKIYKSEIKLTEKDIFIADERRMPARRDRECVRFRLEAGGYHLVHGDLRGRRVYGEDAVDNSCWTSATGFTTTSRATTRRPALSVSGSVSR